MGAAEKARITTSKARKCVHQDPALTISRVPVMPTFGLAPSRRLIREKSHDRTRIPKRSLEV
jgi:hypothetical protein